MSKPRPLWSLQSIKLAFYLLCWSSSSGGSTTLTTTLLPISLAFKDTHSGELELDSDFQFINYKSFFSVWKLQNKTEFPSRELFVIEKKEENFRSLLSPLSLSWLLVYHHILSIFGFILKKKRKKKNAQINHLASIFCFKYINKKLILCVCVYNFASSSY